MSAVWFECRASKVIDKKPHISNKNESYPLITLLKILYNKLKYWLLLKTIWCHQSSFPCKVFTYVNRCCHRLWHFLVDKSQHISKLDSDRNCYPAVYKTEMFITDATYILAIVWCSYRFPNCCNYSTVYRPVNFLNFYRLTGMRRCVNHHVEKSLLCIFWTCNNW